MDITVLDVSRGWEGACAFLLTFALCHSSRCHPRTPRCVSGLSRDHERCWAEYPRCVSNRHLLLFVTVLFFFQCNTILLEISVCFHHPCRAASLLHSITVTWIMDTQSVWENNLRRNEIRLGWASLSLEVESILTPREGLDWEVQSLCIKKKKKECCVSEASLKERRLRIEKRERRDLRRQKGDDQAGGWPGEDLARGGWCGGEAGKEWEAEESAFRGLLSCGVISSS